MKARFFFVPALGVSALLSVILAPQPSQGQVGAEDAALTALLTEVAAQQTALLDNQAKIDAKLAAVSESVRVARIFVSRGGGKAQ